MKDRAREAMTASRYAATEIRAELARQRLSGTALAALLGVPYQTLAPRIGGRRALTLDQTIDIADALKIDPTQLILRRRTPVAPAA